MSPTGTQTVDLCQLELFDNYHILSITEAL